MSKNVLLSLVLTLAVFACGKDSSPVLVDIEGDQQITVNDFKNAEAAMIDQLKQQGLTDDKVVELKGLSPAEVAALPPQLQFIWKSLQPAGVFDNIKQTKLIYRYAKEQGYLDKPEVKKRAQLIVESYIANAYLAQSIKTPDFKEDQLEAECNRIRASAPDNPQIQAMTASQCLEQAKSSLGMQSRNYEMANYMQTIKDRYRVREIEKNVKKYIKKAGNDEEAAKDESKTEKPAN